MRGSKTEELGETWRRAPTACAKGRGPAAGDAIRDAPYEAGDASARDAASEFGEGSSRAREGALGTAAQIRDGGCKGKDRDKGAQDAAAPNVPFGKFDRNKSAGGKRG